MTEKLAESSIRMNRNTLDHNGMRCLANTLNNSLIVMCQLCHNDTEQHRVCSGIENVKNIAEDTKRAGMNNLLPPGLKLVQDVETKFGSTLFAVHRFLKSASKAWFATMNQKLDGELNAYGSSERNNDSESEK